MPVKDGMLVPGVTACCIYRESVCVTARVVYSTGFYATANLYKPGG